MGLEWDKKGVLYKKISQASILFYFHKPSVSQVHQLSAILVHPSPTAQNSHLKSGIKQKNDIQVSHQNPLNF